jgi:cytochrome c
MEVVDFLIPASQSAPFHLHLTTARHFVCWRYFFSLESIFSNQFKGVVMQALLKSLLLAVLVSLAGQAAAEERGSATEAVALVHKVIASLKANGRQKTLDEVNNKKYVDRDLSVSVISVDGISMANLNAKLVGKNVLEIKDVNGKYFVKDGIDAVKKHGNAWIDYSWPNPLSQKIEPKSTYSEKYEDLVISCGIYKDK